MNGMQHLILDILSTQSEGYLCSPHASAFVAAGLEDPDKVQEEMIDLEDNGLVEFYTVEETTTIALFEKDSKGEPVSENGSPKFQLDDDGNLKTEEVTHVVDQGWIITEKGRNALKEV